MPNLSPAESKGPVKKIHLVPTKKPKLPTIKLKGIEGAAQASATISLCDLKSTSARTPSKLGLKKKGKEDKVPLNIKRKCNYKAIR